MVGIVFGLLLVVLFMGIINSGGSAASVGSFSLALCGAMFSVYLVFKRDKQDKADTRADARAGNRNGE